MHDIQIHRNQRLHFSDSDSLSKAAQSAGKALGTQVPLAQQMGVQSSDTTFRPCEPRYRPNSEGVGRPRQPLQASVV